MLGAHISLQVTTLNEAGAKHSYFHLLQPRYYYCPAGFLDESPHKKREDSFNEAETLRIITVAIQ